VVTDADLNVLAEGPSLAIHQSDQLLSEMDDWNTNQHGRSGLTERVRTSTITEADACAATIEFLRRWVPAGQSPMCGNSIGQDRRFLVRYMPELGNFFHYRNLDVSTLKELVRRWKPELENGFAKKGSHLAMDDVYDSIAELAYYRDVFIQS
jgi:oligoribonuclease